MYRKRKLQWRVNFVLTAFHIHFYMQLVCICVCVCVCVCKYVTIRNRSVTNQQYRQCDNDRTRHTTVSTKMSSDKIYLTDWYALSVLRQDVYRYYDKTILFQFHSNPILGLSTCSILLKIVWSDSTSVQSYRLSAVLSISPRTWRWSVRKNLSDRNWIKVYSPLTLCFFWIFTRKKMCRLN